MKTVRILIIAQCVTCLLVLQSCKNNSANESIKIDYDLREDLTPSRLTIAMWDFSWLNMHYPGGAFENWDKVLDELKEHKFNTVRIDAFPLIIGKLRSEEESVTIEGGPLRNWGASDKDRSHPIVKELVEFMALTQKKDIHVILSTWNQGCLEYPDLQATYASSREAYWKAWERVLDILEKDGLLEHVLYVDLDQEFPWFSPYLNEINNLGIQEEPGSDPMVQAGQTEGLAWNPLQVHFVKSHLESSLAHFQRRYPQLRFTFSFTSFWKEFRSMKLKHLDVLELHIWMTQMDRFLSRSGFDQIKKDRGEHDYSDYMNRIDKAMHSIRPMMLKEMHNQMQFAVEWSDEIAAPLTTTEAWGPWWHMDHSDLDWQWLYDWCEQCMGLSTTYGFWGTTPWNYSHPYWDNWKNVGWYQKVNDQFLNH